MTEMNFQLDLARETKRKLDALVEQITTEADAAQRRIDSFQARLARQQEEFDTTLVSINDQLGAVVVRRRELEADILQNRSNLTAGLGEARGAGAEIARLTGALAELIAVDRPEFAERAAGLRSEAQALVERAERAASGERLATVFIQYGKSVAPEVAQAVGTTLEGSGYVVPSEDRMPNDAREVRYFYAEDRAAAGELARSTSAALAGLGFGELGVEVKDFTAWTKAKPRPGTLELWLALPETNAG